MTAKPKVMENYERSWKKSWKVMEFEELKRVRTLHQATFVYMIPGPIGKAHFRVRYDRWIWSNIFTNSNEKKTCLLLCLLCIFKFQTLTCQNFWIFYFTSRLTLHECVVNVCIRWFLLRNWTIRRLHTSNNTPCLPPKILHKHCFQFPLGRLKHPGELKNRGYAKFGGEANKVYCGRCANGELENRSPQIKPSRSKGENYCNSKLPHMASTPEFEPGPHRWEASALTTL